MQNRSTLEKILETVLFRSRWLLAPFYLGLVLSLLALLGAFLAELAHMLPALAHPLEIDPEKIILGVLGLIDLSLAGNLVVIVVFSGYENFVSRIETAAGVERPDWMGTVDFSGLKMKLIGSIVAISAVSLLRTFMALTEDGAVLDEAKLRWLVMLHITFVVTGLLFAVMDWIAYRQK